MLTKADHETIPEKERHLFGGEPGLFTPGKAAQHDEVVVLESLGLGPLQEAGDVLEGQPVHAVELADLLEEVDVEADDVQPEQRPILVELFELRQVGQGPLFEPRLVDGDQLHLGRARIRRHGQQSRPCTDGLVLWSKPTMPATAARLGGGNLGRLGHHRPPSRTLALADAPRTLCSFPCSHDGGPPHSQRCPRTVTLR